MKINSILLALLVTLLIGCHKSVENFSSGSPGRMERSPEISEDISQPEPPAYSKDAEAAPVKLKRPDKIIKEANIQFEVNNYRTAKYGIDSLVNRWGGYIAKEDESYSYNQINNTIIIRVANSEFENLLNAIGATSKKIDYKRVNSIDVTEEFIDIQSRLKTKREVEKRYYEILRKSTKVEDILKVENEIRKIREEIESKEGRLNYLTDRVSHSTITLTIYQYLEHKYKPKNQTDLSSRLHKALDKGWKGLISFLIGLMHIWPILLILLAIFIWYTKFYKRRKKTKQL